MTQTTGQMTAWHQRVAAYLDDLQSCVEQMDESLYNIRAATTGMALPVLDAAQRRLTETLADLETLIAVRQDLITAGDAPGPGLSLRDILTHADGAAAEELAARCKDLAREVELSRERAVAVFVCQFHLSDLSQYLITLLRGVPNPNATYEDGNHARRPTASSGSLLNQSA